jgi:hypothetical protein
MMGISTASARGCTNGTSRRLAPPVEDMLFVMHAVLDAPSSGRQLPGLAGLDLDVAREVLQPACDDGLALGSIAG